MSSPNYVNKRAGGKILCQHHNDSDCCERRKNPDSTTPTAQYHNSTQNFALSFEAMWDCDIGRLGKCWTCRT